MIFGKALGFQTLTTVGATALTVPKGAVLALIQAEAQAVRWRDDGGTPTAAIGITIATGETFEYRGREGLVAFRAIEAVGGGILNVSYYSH